MKNMDSRDLLGGLILIGVGLFVALYAANHYSIGETSRMGPGYFPVALGWILAALGLVIAALSFRRTLHVLTPPPLKLRAMFAVLVSIALFALLLERLGLVPAAMVLAFVASFAGGKFRIRRTLALAVSLAILVWLVFTLGLQMTMPAFAF